MDSCIKAKQRIPSPANVKQSTLQNGSLGVLIWVSVQARNLSRITGVRGNLLGRKIQ